MKAQNTYNLALDQIERIEYSKYFLSIDELINETLKTEDEHI